MSIIEQLEVALRAMVKSAREDHFGEDYKPLPDEPLGLAESALRAIPAPQPNAGLREALVRLQWTWTADDDYRARFPGHIPPGDREDLESKADKILALFPRSDKGESQKAPVPEDITALVDAFRDAIVKMKWFPLESGPFVNSHQAILDAFSDLQRERDRWKISSDHSTEQWSYADNDLCEAREKIQALEGERDRLREALEEIRDTDFTTSSPLIEIARRAVAPTHHKGADDGK
jgi:hypothetical protein